MILHYFPHLLPVISAPLHICLNHKLVTLNIKWGTMAELSLSLNSFQNSDLDLKWSLLFTAELTFSISAYFPTTPVGHTKYTKDVLSISSWLQLARRKIFILVSLLPIYWKVCLVFPFYCSVLNEKPKIFLFQCHEHWALSTQPPLLMMPIMTRIVMQT